MRSAKTGLKLRWSQSLIVVAQSRAQLCFKIFKLTFTTLRANSEDDKLMIFS